MDGEYTSGEGSVPIHLALEASAEALRLDIHADAIGVVRFRGFHAILSEESREGLGPLVV